MISYLHLPKLQYMIFELIRFEILDEPGDNGYYGLPESLDVIVMDVFPSRITYRYSSKKTYHAALGDNNVTSEHGGVAPVKISLQGTFGQRYIRRGLKIQDGFGRLKEFKDLFMKSQSVVVSTDNIPNQALPTTTKRYVYGMNFYDFTEHYWGAIDLDTFEIEKDAHTHSQVPSYAVQFTGIGTLIQAIPKDPLLRNLQFLITVNDKLDILNADINNLIGSSPVLSSINDVLTDIQMLGDALFVAQSISGQVLTVLGTLTHGIAEVPGQMANLGDTVLSFPNDIQGGVQSVLSTFADLL